MDHQAIRQIASCPWESSLFSSFFRPHAAKEILQRHSHIAEPIAIDTVFKMPAAETNAALTNGSPQAIHVMGSSTAVTLPLDP